MLLLQFIVDSLLLSLFEGNETPKISKTKGGGGGGGGGWEGGYDGRGRGIGKTGMPDFFIFLSTKLMLLYLNY